MKINPKLHWLLRLVPAIIVLQTLFYKFGGHADSIKIFTQLGIEPWGRIGTGVIELIAGILLLIPRYTRYGALICLGTMGGAILSHIFVLGIEFENDGGALFIAALVVALTSLILLYLEKDKLINIYKQLFGGNS